MVLADRKISRPRRMNVKFIAIYAAVAVLLVFTLGPYLYMVTVAIRPVNELYHVPFAYWPAHATLDNFLDVALSRTANTVDLGASFLRSTVVALSATILALILAALGGYSLARFRFRGRELTGMALLATQMLPAVLFLVPLFIIFRQLHLLNSLAGLVVAYLTFALPYSTWTLRSYIEALPMEAEDAALVDGCNRLQAIWFVVLPMARPGLVATGAFAFILSWNEFLFAFILSGNRPLLTVSLFSFITQWGPAYTQLMAGAVLASLPPMILFLSMQTWLVGGLAAGAVK